MGRSYQVLERYRDAATVKNLQTGEIEAVKDSVLRALLYFGVDVAGATVDGNGEMTYSPDIHVLTDFEVYAMENGVVEDEEEDDFIDEEDYIDEEEDDVDDEDVYFDDEEDIVGEGVEDIYFDDEDDVDEPDSAVSKLYQYLTPDQQKILKRYYLWYSRELFKYGTKDKTYGMKDKRRIAQKTADLKALRDTGGMWAYAGFIDTGYMGGGYCSMGHELRYMHLAWDVAYSDIEMAFFGEQYNVDFEQTIQSEHCIVFGIKCITDFFEVDKDCMLKLQRAQRESLKDMDILREFYEQGAVEQVNESFTLADPLVAKLKVTSLRMEREWVNGGLLAFYTQFRQAGMPVPKSLMQEIRDQLVGWQFHKFIWGRYGIGEFGDDFYAAMSDIIGVRWKVLGEKLKSGVNSYYYNINNYLKAYFMYRICGVYQYDADKNKDEGGASKRARIEYRTRINAIDRLFSGAEYSLGYITKLCNMEMLLQKVDEQEDNAWRSEERFKPLFAATRRIDFQKATIDDKYAELERLLSEWSEEARKREEEARKREEEAKLAQQSQQSQPQGQGVSEEACLAYLSTINIDACAGTDLQKSILRTVRDSGRTPSDKQMKHLRALYTALTGQEVVARNEVSDKDVLAYLSGVDIDACGGTDLQRSILRTVRNRGGKPSYKQMYHLRELYKNLTAEAEKHENGS